MLQNWGDFFKFLLGWQERLANTLAMPKETEMVDTGEEQIKQEIKCEVEQRGMESTSFENLKHNDTLECGMETKHEPEEEPVQGVYCLWSQHTSDYLILALILNETTPIIIYFNNIGR